MFNCRTCCSTPVLGLRGSETPPLGLLRGSKTPKEGERRHEPPAWIDARYGLAYWLLCRQYNTEAHQPPRKQHRRRLPTPDTRVTRVSNPQNPQRTETRDTVETGRQRQRRIMRRNKRQRQRRNMCVGAHAAGNTVALEQRRDQTFVGLLLLCGHVKLVHYRTGERSKFATFSGDVKPIEDLPLRLAPLKAL